MQQQVAQESCQFQTLFKPRMCEVAEASCQLRLPFAIFPTSFWMPNRIVAQSSLADCAGGMPSFDKRH